MSWTQIWIFPPHKRSYCLGSCYVPPSCFFSNICYHILYWFVFGVSNICGDYFITLSVWNEKRIFFRILYSWLSFCLKLNSSYLSLYVFPSCDYLVLKHHSALKFSWLLNMCSRGTLLASLNPSIVFYLFFFIMYLQSFLSQRVNVLVHPYLWSLLFLMMVNMCLSTTFKQWEGYARNDGSGVYSSSFTSDDFITWPRAPLDGYLSTARIVLSSLLIMTSITKNRLYNASSTIYRIAEYSIILRFHRSYLGPHVILLPLLSFMQHHTYYRTWSRGPLKLSVCFSHQWWRHDL